MESEGNLGDPTFNFLFSTKITQILLEKPRNNVGQNFQQTSSNPCHAWAHKSIRLVKITRKQRCEEGRPFSFSLEASYASDRQDGIAQTSRHDTPGPKLCYLGGSHARSPVVAGLSLLLLGDARSRVRPVNPALPGA